MRTAIAILLLSLAANTAVAAGDLISVVTGDQIDPADVEAHDYLEAAIESNREYSERIQRLQREASRARVTVQKQRADGRASVANLRDAAQRTGQAAESADRIAVRVGNANARNDKIEQSTTPIAVIGAIVGLTAVSIFAPVLAKVLTESKWKDRVQDALFKQPPGPHSTNTSNDKTADKKEAA